MLCLRRPLFGLRVGLFNMGGLLAQFDGLAVAAANEEQAVAGGGGAESPHAFLSSLWSIAGSRAGRGAAGRRAMFCLCALGSGTEELLLAAVRAHRGAATRLIMVFAGGGGAG